MKFCIKLFMVSMMCVAVPALANPSIDVFGYYFPADEQANTADFEYFQLDSSNEKKKAGSITGLLHINVEGKEIDLKIHGSLKGKTLEFTSQPHDGNSYSFSGNFKRVGDFPMEQPEDKDIVHGSLRVFKNETLVRQHKMKFRYEAGD